MCTYGFYSDFRFSIKLCKISVFNTSFVHAQVNHYDLIYYLFCVNGHAVLSCSLSDFHKSAFYQIVTFLKSWLIKFLFRQHFWIVYASLNTQQITRRKKYLKVLFLCFCLVNQEYLRGWNIFWVHSFQGNLRRTYTSTQTLCYIVSWL